MKPEAQAEILRKIDEELERPPISIEEALQEAVRAGRMSIKECEECLEAYHRTLQYGA